MANSIITNPVENKVATINNVYNWLKPRYEKYNYPWKVLLKITYPNSKAATSSATLTYQFDSFTSTKNGTHLVLRLTSITGTSLQAIYNNDLGKDLSTLYFPVVLSNSRLNWENMNYYEFFASSSNSYNLVGNAYHTLDKLSTLNVVFEYDVHLLKGAKYICEYSGMEFANLYIDQTEGSLVPGYENSSKKGLTESEYSSIFKISSTNTKCITHDEIDPRIYDQVYTLVYGDVYRNGTLTNYVQNRYDGSIKIFPPRLSGIDVILGKTQTIGARFLGIIGSGSGKLGDIEIGYGNTGGFNNIIIRNREGRMRFSNSSYGFNIYEFNSESEGMGHMLSPSGSTDLTVKYGDHIYFDNDPLCKPYLCPAIRKGDNIGNKFYNSIVEYAKYTDAINWYYHPTLQNTKLNSVSGLDDSQKIQEDSIGNAIIPIMMVPSGLDFYTKHCQNSYYDAQNDGISIYQWRNSSIDGNITFSCNVVNTFTLQLCKYGIGTGSGTPLKWSDYTDDEWEDIRWYLYNHTGFRLLLFSTNGAPSNTPAVKKNITIYPKDSDFQWNKNYGDNVYINVSITKPMGASTAEDNVVSQYYGSGTISIYAAAALVMKTYNHTNVDGPRFVMGYNNSNSNPVGLLGIRACYLENNYRPTVPPTSIIQVDAYGKYDSTYETTVENYIKNNWTWS